MTTVQTLLVVDAILDWYTIQMDVTNPFLHGDLHETVYIRLPQGYTHFGSRISVNDNFKSSVALVCLLLKSLYGLKQAIANGSTSCLQFF